MLRVRAAKAQDHSCVFLRNHEVLQDNMWRIDLQARGVLGSAGSLPENVVAIQDDHRVPIAASPIYSPGDGGCQGCKERRFVRDLSQLVAVLVRVIDHWV